MTDLAQRKVVELQHKLESLRREFEHWLAQSEALQPLEKHHTQIRRVTRQLESFREEIGRTLPAASRDGTVALARCRETELQILEVHRLWEFFRSKLVPRRVDWFKTYLAAADELAWACYSAARDRVPKTHIPPEAIKEPPLVFFNGSASPFAMPRNVAYEAEFVPEEPVQTQQIAAALKSLPIPVIGIPWFQLQHLSDALIIGHEVGHAVEDDFGLSSHVAALLKAAMAKAGTPSERQGAWHAWSDEIFADLYGTLATGPAFVSALADFLALDSAAITQEHCAAGDWGDYPTDYLRILLVLEMLSQRGFTEQSSQGLAVWKTAYSSHRMTAFEEDIPVIVRALREGPYPQLSDAALDQVLLFSEAAHDRAQKDADRVLTKRAPVANDVRQLFAAARLSFERDPEGYETAGAGERILKHVLELRPQGVRAPGRREDERTRQAKDLYDRDRGRALFQLFSRPEPADAA